MAASTLVELILRWLRVFDWAVFEMEMEKGEKEPGSGLD